ncbi:MAG TPA: hypothetical protein VK947_02085 [Planococcus sp. (in: firmicutes)]|nr:hypothetical protein [Planococcus sp. (in: firmicutes)]
MFRTTLSDVPEAHGGNTRFNGRCFIPHLEKLVDSSLPMPKTVIADAGYGSEENYLYALGDEKHTKISRTDQGIGLSYYFFYSRGEAEVEWLLGF